MRIGTFVFLGLALTIAPVRGQGAPEAGELRLSPCERDGIEAPARCGTFTVQEDRAGGSGRTIDLNVVVLEATGTDPRPDPWVLLVGGPGADATSAARGLSGSGLRETHDILLVDQRGTGSSNGLFCPRDGNGDAPLQSFMATLDADRARTCRAELSARADLRYYLTIHAMDDLDDLRAALGYESLNLVGESYGTRAALVYIRRHGDRVRSATLMASTALSHPMPARFAADAEAALRNVLDECMADRECAWAFPALEEDYRAAVRGIEEEGPIALRVRDPRSGDSVRVELGAGDFAESLRAMLYSADAARRIPLLLHGAAAGDYGPFADFQLRRNLGLAQGVAEGMYFAVTCTEDVARVDPEAVYADGRGTFLADHRARPHIEGCDGWPLGEIPPDFGEEVDSEVPVLFLTGANDPVTPPASAFAASARLSNSRVIIVPEGGHGFAGLEGAECIDAIAARFLETADPAAVDAECVDRVRRRPFVLPTEGDR